MWFKNSSLSILWRFPHKLTCQNFLNHYQYIDHETSRKIEDDLSRVLIEKGITPQILFLDESNWFTHIERGEELPQKGKNKQFGSDKNLVSVGLAVSEDNVPFMHETYEGNKHDAKIFPELMDALTERLSNLKITTENLILVFDNGSNSRVKRHEFFGQNFTTVVVYNEASYKKQKKSYEKKKSKILKKLADLKGRLESNKGKGRSVSSHL